MIDLHLHTKYSLLDAIIEPEDLVKKTKELGRSAICVTEHGNLYSSVEMYKLCKKHNIKYIMGCEVYICDDVEVKDKNSRYNHLIVIAKNETGRLNLIKLVSKSSQYKYYGKPRIDFNMLQEHKEGLIVSSACLGGEVMRAIQDNDYSLAKSIALRYKQEFGEDYYLEYQSHADSLQQESNRKIVDLAKELDIKYIVTTDSHYLNKEDQKYHGVFVQIGQAREVGETYNDCYMQTEDEILEMCKSTTREENLLAMQTTHEIADKCNVEIPLSAPIMPHVSIPQQFTTEVEYLKYLCAKGWIARNINVLSNAEQEKYKDRLLYEIDSIEKMGFEGYYLLVESYATSVERRGIARGSGGGSLVAYLTHIVDIDPVKYGLYFERFIDVGALKLLEEGKITKAELKIPDFDLDFGKQDREKVVQSIISQYGKSRFAKLGSFQYIWAKGAIKDIGKVLDIPFEITNEMTKQFDNETIDEVMELGLLSQYEKEYPELFEYANKLAGLPKSFSVHPCGCVIAMQDVDYYNAIEIDEVDGLYVLQGDMHTAEDLGLVKIDLLGLRTVDMIYDTLALIGKDYEYIAPHLLNFNDEKVLNEFRLGNTDSVFQFESGGMKGTLRGMNVDSLYDLFVANALFRPGSMQFISDYSKRKKGLEDVTYLHSDLEEILGNTYGIIVFQEQLIEIGRLANLSNPDLLRKATGKKDEKLMMQIQPELTEGLIKRGWNKEQIDELWDIMIEFAKYSFNLSHSAAYAIIAYICMYLKVYHPKEWIVAWINSYNGKIDKIGGCIEEAKRLNVEISTPSWRNICDKTTLYNESIYAGTESIKFLNGTIAHEIKALADSQYESFLDLYIDLKEKTSCGSRDIDILIKLDFFTEFGNSKKLVKIVEMAEWLDKKQISKDRIDKTPFTIEQVQSYANKETEKQFREIDFKSLIKSSIKNIANEDFTIVEKMEFQRTYLGYVNLKMPNVSPDIALVTDVELNRYGTPFVTLYRLNNGETETLKVDKKMQTEKPLKEFELIKTISIETKNKVRKVNDEWIRLNETENMLVQWVGVTL